MKFVFLSKSYVKILRSYKPTYNSRKIILNPLILNVKIYTLSVFKA